jgi:hypothetical protein
MDINYLKDYIPLLELSYGFAKDSETQLATNYILGEEGIFRYRFNGVKDYFGL